MKKLIITLSVALLLGTGLIALSQEEPPIPINPGQGGAIGKCSECISALILEIKSTIGEIIIGSSSGTDLAGKVIVIVGVPSDRAGLAVNNYNRCVVENNCSDSPICVVR